MLLVGSYCMTGQIFGVSIYGKTQKFRMFKITPDLSVAYTVWRITINTIFVIKQTNSNYINNNNVKNEVDSLGSSVSQLSLQGIFILR